MKERVIWNEDEKLKETLIKLEAGQRITVTVEGTVSGTGSTLGPVRRDRLAIFLGHKPPDSFVALENALVTIITEVTEKRKR